ncbi:sulfate adenylyltransferase subunit 1 [Granulicoccus phenolivorans]|uniref:sulfate adenylyltransferase subunit 1 n=1 Tax=Granulicoccus phenolivorans TaxID=266854 RepID=UPI00040B4C1D|nr:GTP-binding protein [Granulicoccus phenolivorans]
MSTLLRLATAGSVDDGKSTLVGRLLHDTKSIMADQLEAVERVSADRGLEAADLALLTDGLRAEREQGITIDVAYRYFATPNRSFILADCPGHVQYTRNTVTGSSTADVIVLLVDVRHGVLEQTRRHLAVASLLRVPHVIVAINKIDLVGFDADTIRGVQKQVSEVAAGFGLTDVTTIPVSALRGDNVVTRSEHTPFYAGPALLELLEQIPNADSPTQEQFRFPVQYVLRPQAAAVDPALQEYRGYAGQIASGVVRVGDRVSVEPSGRPTTIAGIDTADGPLEVAFAPQSVSLRLTDDIDLARGDMIVAADSAPEPTREIDAFVCWLAERPLKPGARVLLKHTSHTVQAVVTEIGNRLDLDTLGGTPATELALNDIGRVRIKVASPIVAEAYATSRRLGAFLLIDAQSAATLAAGMVASTTVEEPEPVNWVI